MGLTIKNFLRKINNQLKESTAKLKKNHPKLTPTKTPQIYNTLFYTNPTTPFLKTTSKTTQNITIQPS